MNNNTRGVMFFNFGDKCVARLLTAIYTLQKVYSGPITVALAKKDNTNVLLERIFNNINVDVLWFDFDQSVKRNIKSSLKPYLFSISPYDTTLMFDGDLIFTKPINELWEKIEEKGFLVTHFSNWYSHGNSMKKRVLKLSKVLNQEQINAALNKHPAVNIGVLGYNKKNGGKLLRKWANVTKQVAGMFIADEIAMQGVYFWYDHFLADGKYNYSCHFGRDFDKAHIIHYHGNKHTNIKRYSSRLWWGAVKTAIEELPILQLETWLLSDPQAKEVLSNTPIEKILECKIDWSNYLNNKVITEEDEEISEDQSDEK